MYDNVGLSFGKYSWIFGQRMAFWFDGLGASPARVWVGSPGRRLARESCHYNIRGYGLKV